MAKEPVEYLLKPNGKPERTADGERMRADFFEADPYLDPKRKPLTAKEVDDELKRLGLIP